LSSPVTGEIIAVNSVAVDDPEQINVNPYETWLFSVKADDLSEMDDWLDSQAYLQIIE
jgi:glycine cleavage system H protein